MHLNQMYDKLSKPGVRGTGVKSVAIISVAPLLQEKNLTRQQLAKQAGVSPSTVTEFCSRRPIMRQKAERTEVNYFQPEQIWDILNALESEPLKWQVLAHILMITGGRRGEVVGLEWSKIDFERKRLRFDSALLFSKEIGLYEGSTKTGNRRYVPLPDETIALLRELRTEQKEQRLLMGDRWHENDYIFKRDDGQPMRPDSITQWLSKFADRHGLQHINPHAFRHTAASVMIVNGTDIVTVSKMLGHAKVSTTEDIYSHVIEDSKQQASNGLADVYYREKAQKQA